MAFDPRVEEIDIQTALDTMGFLVQIQEAQFGKSAMTQHFSNALTAVDRAGTIVTMARDPKRGISEAVQSTIMAGMNEVPVLCALNVAGEISSVLLPTLRATEAKLASDPSHEKLLRDYQEAMGIFVVCAAYREGMQELIAKPASELANLLVGGFNKLIDSAVVLGMPKVARAPSDAPKKVLPGVVTWAEKAGTALQTDKQTEPLFREYVSSLSLSSTSSASGPRIAPGKTIIDPSKPDVRVGLTIFGGAATGYGAAVTVSSGITLTAIATGGLALVAVALGIFMSKKFEKKKKKEFKEGVERIIKGFDKFVEEINNLCTAKELSVPDKLKKLNEISERIKREYIDHGAAITKLDGIVGAKAARPVGDKLRSMFTELKNELDHKIIPGLVGPLTFGGRAAGAASSVSVAHGLTK